MNWSSPEWDDDFQAYVKITKVGIWKHYLIGIDGASTSDEIDDDHIHVKCIDDGEWVLCMVKENGNSQLHGRRSLIERINEVTGLNIES